MVSAAVILQPGKVGVHAIPDHAPPPYLRFMRPTKPLYVSMKEYEHISPTTSLEIETIKLKLHRVIGLSVSIAYWPDSWQDAWAIEELLKWEGRVDEIRREKYYADFVVQENQPASHDERREIESEPVPPGQRPMVLVVHESVQGRDVDARPAISGRTEPNDLLRLERGAPSGHAGNLSAEDGG